MTGVEGVADTASSGSSLAERLWNPAVGPRDYAEPGGEQYRAAVMEQYKLYVEMADRISARRGLTNTFFLTLNGLLLTAVGAVSSSRAVPHWAMALVALGAVVQCMVWYLLVHSYRQLNSAKYAVIGELEERLPARPYSRAEWALLGQGRQSRRYVPLTRAEQWVPTLFAAAYLGVAALLLVTG